MKKLIALILILILILIAITTTATAELYYRFGEIVDLEYDTDCVTADDGMGNLWEFYGVDWFYTSDLIVMFIDDNNTPDYIYDDAVVNAYTITAEDAQELIKKQHKK